MQTHQERDPRFVILTREALKIVGKLTILAVENGDKDLALKIRDFTARMAEARQFDENDFVAYFRAMIGVENARQCLKQSHGADQNTTRMLEFIAST